MSEEIKKKLASLEKRVDALESTKKEPETIILPCDDAWWQNEEEEEIFLPIDIEFWEERAKKEQKKKKIDEKVKEALNSEIELEETPTEEG